MKNSITTLLAAMAFSSVLLAPSVSAEPANIAAAGRHSEAERQALIDQRLAQLKDELKIMPNQEGAWQAYSDTMKQTMQRPARPDARQGQAQLTAPERMARHIERMKQRLAKMEVMATAMQNLYAQLTPEQRTIADMHAARFNKKHRR